MNNKYTFVALCAYIVLLTACATGGGPANTSLDEPEDLPDVYGVAAVQVVTNGFRISQTLLGWTSVLVVDNGDREKNYSLDVVKDGYSSNPVFVGALPPGEYSIYALHSYARIGDASYWFNAPVPPSIGKFEVLADHVTSLGTIVYQPLASETEEGAENSRSISYSMTRVDTDEDFSVYVEGQYPRLSGIGKPGILSWNEDNFADSRQLLLNQFKQVARSNRYVALDDGEIIASPGKLGQLYFRTRRSGWSRVDTGRVDELLSIAKWGDTYVMSGDRGLIVRSDDIAGPWEPVAGAPAREAIVKFVTTTDNALFALTQAEEEHRLYRIVELGKPWDRVNNPALSILSQQSKKWYGYAHVIPGNNGSLFIFSDKERVHWDRKNKEWSSTDTASLTSLFKQPNGILVGFPVSAWTGIADPVFSMDNGKSFETLDRRVSGSYYIANASTPFVASPDDILMVASPMVRDGRRKLVTGRSIHLYRGDSEKDARKNEWKKQGELWPDCYGLLPAISSAEEQFMMCLDGRLLRSTDMGATWKLDKDVSNPKIEPYEPVQRLPNEA